MTMERALWVSSNPAMVLISKRLGVKTFMIMCSPLDIWKRLGIDLPGEQVGLNHENPVMLTWQSGPSVSNRPLRPFRCCRLHAAFGNGGILLQPQVADYFTDRNGNVVHDIQPKELRRILSPQTTETMLRYLRGVVTEGTAPVAEVPGYHPAGKTSTSTHGPKDEFSVISFASVAPLDNPQIAVLIILYLPNPSTTSWPAQYVSSRATEKTLEYLKVPRNYTVKKQTKCLRAGACRIWSAVRVIRPEPMPDMQILICFITKV